MNDFAAEMAKQQAELDRSDAEAKARGELVGRYIQHAYADGHAVYRITAATATHATIEVVEIGDAWVLPAWGRKKRLPIREVRGFLVQRDALARMFNASDDWWAQQPVGTTVHYSNGGNQFVRGTIVEHEGRKQILPTAMVGSGWHQRDLWMRSADGSITYGYHVKNILAKTPWQPNSGNMVEAPGHQLRGEDPRGMTPVSFEPPAMTAAQIKLAEIAGLHGRVTEALKHEHSADPEILAEHIRAALDRAKALLRE